MIVGPVLLLAATGADLHVLNTLAGDDLARMGIVADLVERPRHVAGEAFAQQLVDAEGLRTWNGEQIEGPSRAAMSVKAVVAGNGREIDVYYLARPGPGDDHVCRLRLNRGGASTARWRAYRWCASSFGISTPETWPPPVGTTSR
jgi:hypothetical protein